MRDLSRIVPLALAIASCGFTLSAAQQTAAGETSRGRSALVHGAVHAGGQPVAGAWVFAVWTPDADTPPSTWVEPEAHRWPQELRPPAICPRGRFDGYSWCGMQPGCASDGSGRFQLEVDLRPAGEEPGVWWLIAHPVDALIAAEPTLLGSLDGGQDCPVHIELPSARVIGRLRPLPESMQRARYTLPPLHLFVVPEALWSETLGRDLSVGVDARSGLSNQYCGGPYRPRGRQGSLASQELRQGERFEIGCIPDGRYVLCVTWGGTQLLLRRRVAIRAGHGLDLGDLAIEGREHQELRVNLPAGMPDELAAIAEPRSPFFRSRVEEWRESRLEEGNGWVLCFTRAGKRSSWERDVGRAVVRGDGICRVALPAGVYEVQLAYRWRFPGLSRPGWMTEWRERHAVGAAWGSQFLRVDGHGRVLGPSPDWSHVTPPWDRR